MRMVLLVSVAVLLAVNSLAGEKPLRLGSSGAEDLPLLADPAVMLEGGASTLVRRGPDGKLLYKTDADGNRICDFSFAGYRGGGVALPQVPVVETLKPQDGDDTARIQAALDRIAAKPLDATGFRGALLLSKGKYVVRGTLQIKASGVVLRGEGPSFSKTWIFHERPANVKATGPVDMVHVTQRERGIEPTLFVQGGVLSTKKAASVTTPLLPAGATVIAVDSVKDLKAGAPIVIVVNYQQKWLDRLGLNKQWALGAITPKIPRLIRAVDAARNEITLDAPLNVRIDSNNGHASAEIHTHLKDSRIKNVGVEGILFISDYDKSKKDKDGYFVDEDHANIAVSMLNVEDGWVRDCTGFFYSFSMVSINYSSRITVQDCAMLDGVSRDTPLSHAGARKYSFNMCGHDILLQRCYSRLGRHAFTGSGPQGGVVFLDCFSEREHLPSEWHQNWGHGHIFDSVATHSAISIAGINNSSHGQRAAFAVIWNCFVNNQRTFEQDIRVNQMPGCFTNYAIGNIHRGSGKIGLFDGAGSIGEAGVIESPGRFVQPRSLYLAQLEERLGKAAVAAIATPDQLTGRRGAVWAKLIERYAHLPLYPDPAQAPWNER